MSVVPLESKLFEVPAVLAVGGVFVLIVWVSIYMTFGRYKVHLFRRGR